jgi:hypothetical protein
VKVADPLKVRACQRRVRYLRDEVSAEANGIGGVRFEIVERMLEAARLLSEADDMLAEEL